MRRIVLFDGVCMFSNGTVNFIINRDHEEKFQFASLQSESGQSLLYRFQLPVNDLKAIVYLEENNVYTKSTAVLRILKDL